MSVYEQKMEKEVNGFELVEKEEDRTESPEMVEIEDKEEGKDVEVETAKNPENVEVEAREQRWRMEDSLNLQLIVEYFNQHGLEEENENELSAPWSIPESVEDEYPKLVEAVKKAHTSKAVEKVAFGKIRTFMGVEMVKPARLSAKKREGDFVSANIEEDEEETKEDDLVELSISEKMKESIQDTIANFDSLALSINHTRLGRHEIVLNVDHLKKGLLIFLPFFLMFGLIISNWLANLAISSQLTEIANSIQSHCGCTIRMENSAATTWRPSPVTFCFMLVLGLIDHHDRKLGLTWSNVFFEFIFAYSISICIRVFFSVVSLIF